MKFFSKLRKDKRGILYVWIACALFIGVMALAWFPLSWVIYKVIDTCTAAFDYPAEALTTISLFRNVVAWFLDIAAAGMITWAFVASQRKDPSTDVFY